MKKLSDYVIEFIAKQGVKHIFVLPGGGCMHLVDSLGRCKEIEYICNLHEQACTIAAESYGQYTNNLGVALVTTGPGGTNAITGVAAAWLESTPCLIVSGQVKLADLKTNRGVRQMGFQELDIVEIIRSITKYSITVTDPNSIRYHLEKAVFLARSGRPGPVWLDLPLDIQASMIDESNLMGFDRHDLSKADDINYLKLKVCEAINLLNQSERPVVLVGNGVRLANAQEKFLNLIETLKIPVLTTWKAIDFLPETHWLYVGRPGSIGQRGANFSQQNSDFILITGARLDFGQTGYNHQNFARSAKKVIVDIDFNEINKMMMKIDVPICADAKAFIQEFLCQSKNIVNKDRSNWLEKCKEWQAKYPVVQPSYWKEKKYVNPYILVEVLSEEMSGEDLLIPGSSGACSDITMQAFKVKSGMRIFNSLGLGAMGFGIPASIGGCLANGRRRTICIDGDGGFQLNIQELETVKRLCLPIKYFVLCNQGYGSIRATQRNYFDGHYVASDPSSGLTLPSVRKVARAYGIQSLTIYDHIDIKSQIRKVLNSEGPFVVEVRVSPDHVASPRLSSIRRADGTMVSMPLEDLWPFLDREEFRSNMIVPITNE